MAHGYRAVVYLTGALLLALLMSTQFLAQPFVWQYFDGAQILLGWRLIFQDRLLVAVWIAVALLVADVLQARRARQDFVPVLLAVVIGALLGELTLAAIDPDGNRNDAMGISGRVLSWTIAVTVGCFIYHLWRRSDAAAALSHSAELRRLRAERLLRRLRVESLQRQIEPHFLFNTLATIRRLHRSDLAEGQILLSRFCEFLRGNLDAGTDIGSRLGDELEIAAAYLHICALRMAGLLTWRVEVPAELMTMAFPRFGLATLLENAVKHGIAPAPDGGSILITARLEGGLLVVSVTDTGLGFTGDHGHGVGLANIREQLELRYGRVASLSLLSNRPSGVRAIIRVPPEPAA